MASARMVARIGLGIGGSVPGGGRGHARPRALVHPGERPPPRRNTFWTPAFEEWDAGASWERGAVRVAVVGRNLGDDRHPVSESDIGDSQFYISAPRRVTGSVTVRY